MEKNLIKKFRNRRKMKSLGKTKKVGRRGDRLVAKTNRTLKRYKGGALGFGSSSQPKQLVDFLEKNKALYSDLLDEDKLTELKNATNTYDNMNIEKTKAETKKTKAETEKTKAETEKENALQKQRYAIKVKNAAKFNNDDIITKAQKVNDNSKLDEANKNVDKATKEFNDATAKLEAATAKLEAATAKLDAATAQLETATTELEIATARVTEEENELKPLLIDIRYKFNISIEDSNTCENIAKTILDTLKSNLTSDYGKNRNTDYYRYVQDPNDLSRGIGKSARQISKGVRQNVTNDIGLTSKFNDGQYNKDVLAIDPTLEKTLKAKLYEYAYQYRDLLIRKYENNKNARNDLKARSDNFKIFKISLFKRRGNFEYQHKFDDGYYDKTLKELNDYLKEKNTEIANATKKIDDIRLQSGQPGLSEAEQALTILQRDLGRINDEIKGLEESRKKYTDECTSIDRAIKEFQKAFVEWAKGLSTDQPVTLEQDALKALETKILETKILTPVVDKLTIELVIAELEKFAKKGSDSSADKVKNEKELPKKRAELAKMVEEQQKIEKKKKDFETRQAELETAGKKEGTEYANTEILLGEIKKDLEKINAEIDKLQEDISGLETAIKGHGDTTDRDEVSIQLLTNYKKTKERADKEEENNKTKHGSKVVFVLQLLSRDKTLLESKNSISSFFSKQLYPIWLDSMDVLRKIVFSTFTTNSDDSSTSAIIGAVLAAISSEPAAVEPREEEDEEEEEEEEDAEDDGEMFEGGAYNASGGATCTISPIIIPNQKKGSIPTSNTKNRYLVIYQEKSDTFLGITETIDNNNVTVKVIAKVDISETQEKKDNDEEEEEEDDDDDDNGDNSDYKDENANPEKNRCKITKMVTLLENRNIDTKAISYFIELKISEGKAESASAESDTPVSAETPLKRTKEQIKQEAANLRSHYKDKSGKIIERWFEMIENVYAFESIPDQKDIVDLYIDTNNTMHLTLSIPNGYSNRTQLLKILQDDFIKVIKGERTEDDSCDAPGPGKEKEKRSMDLTSKEYKVDVDFLKRRFYKLDPETGEPILDANGNPETIIPTDDDPPFYRVHSKMLKRGKKYRGRSAFFAHMLDDFKTAEMSLWFLRHPDHKKEIAATRETVNVVSEDDLKAINKQNTDEIKKFEQMQQMKETSYKNKLAKETKEYEKERPISENKV